MRSALLVALLSACACGGQSRTVLPGSDGGVLPDGSTSSSDGAPRSDGSAPSDLAMMSKAQASLTFSGCNPQLTDLIVSANSDTIAVANRLAPASGDFEFQLNSTGAVALSTQERVQSGDVIDLVADGETYTNVSSVMPDPISGTLTINQYNIGAGLLDLAFDHVVLEGVEDHALCTISGTLKTTGLSF